MKLDKKNMAILETMSPPRTGAWIETLGFNRETKRYGSPPRTGAWIETSSTLNPNSIGNVAPSHGGVD